MVLNKCTILHASFYHQASPVCPSLNLGLLQLELFNISGAGAEALFITFIRSLLPILQQPSSCFSTPFLLPPCIFSCWFMGIERISISLPPPGLSQMVSREKKVKKRNQFHYFHPYKCCLDSRPFVVMYCYCNYNTQFLLLCLFCMCLVTSYLS